MGPVMSIINKMNALSNEMEIPEELLKLMNDLNVAGATAYSELKEFDDEFEQIRNSSLEFEEKIKSLNDLLDQRETMVLKEGILDFGISAAECEALFGKDVWDKLEEQTQRYIIMANYLLKIMQKNEADLSPSVLEYGRSVENELIEKIYRDFVKELDGKTYGMFDRDNSYALLIQAVRHLNGDEFYIPSLEMVNYLKYLKRKGDKNDYNEAFKDYLGRKNINIEMISDDNLTGVAYELFDKYRNDAAHAGGELEEKDALKCKEKTKKVIKRVIKAIN